MAGSVALAGPASADVAEGWAPVEHVDPWQAVLLFVGIPLAVVLFITAIYVLPPLLRGEPIAPGGRPVQDRWIGGPSKGTAALAAPDDEHSQAGGASGHW